MASRQSKRCGAIPTCWRKTSTGLYQGGLGPFSLVAERQLSVLDRREYATVLKNTTSCLEEYAQIGTGGQVAMRKLCVRNLQEKIAEQYSSYLEPMAGIGVDAQAFNADLTYVNDV